MSPIKCVTLEEELQKNPELRMSDIQTMREWCEKQPHLPKIQDVEIAIFLHSTYYKIEATKSKIENYYTIRTQMPEFFFNRDPLKDKRVQESFKAVAVFCLKEKTKEGYDILIGRFIDYDPSHFVYNALGKQGFMSHDEFLWTNGTSPGLIFIGDATGISMGHTMHLNPMTLKKFMYYIQDGFPVRLKEIHIIHLSPIVEIIYNILKPFIKAKLSELIHFHSSLESASQYFPIDALPNESGGKAGPIKELMDEQIKKIMNFREWYLEYDSVNRVDESLRIDKDKTNELFGIEGSFKKLDID